MYTKRASKANAHTDAIYSVQWTSSGDIVTGSLDETVCVWSHTHTTGTDESGGHGKDSFVQKKVYEGHDLGVISAVVRQDGKQMAVSSLDCQIRLYDAESGTLENAIDAGPVESWSLAYHPTNPVLATGGQDGNVTLWDSQKAEKMSTLNLPNGNFILSVDYAKDGKTVAAGSHAGAVGVFDTEASKLAYSFDDLKMPVRSVGYSKDGNLLFAACDDTHVNMYDCRQQKKISSLTSHSGWVLGLDVSPDEKHFATGSSDNTVNVWDIGLRKCLHTFDSRSEQVWDVAYNSDGRKLVSVGDDAGLFMYELGH